MDIDRPEHATQDSATLVDSPGVTVANSGVLHHEESHISPEERRFEAYTRSIVPAPNTQDTATNDLFAYHMPKLYDVSFFYYVKGMEKGTNQSAFARTASKTLLCSFAASPLKNYHFIVPLTSPSTNHRCPNFARELLCSWKKPDTSKKVRSTVGR